jgi:hypothetical protein
MEVVERISGGQSDFSLLEMDFFSSDSEVSETDFAEGYVEEWGEMKEVTLNSQRRTRKKGELKFKDSPLSKKCGNSDLFAEEKDGTVCIISVPSMCCFERKKNSILQNFLDIFDSIEIPNFFKAKQRYSWSPEAKAAFHRAINTLELGKKRKSPLVPSLTLSGVTPANIMEEMKRSNFDMTGLSREKVASKLSWSLVEAKEFVCA